MKLVVDDLHDPIHGPFYMDILLSPDELDRIRSGEMISCSQEIQGKRFYVGALRQGRFFYEREDIWEEGQNTESYE
jgi:hypothetical protein